MDNDSQTPDRKPTDWFHRLLARAGNGWIVQGDESTSDRKNLVQYNLTANTIANLVGGNFFTGFMLLMKADDAFIGEVTILIFAANLLQLLAPYILERFERRKAILITIKVFIHLLNIVLIGCIPFFPIENQSKLRFFAVVTFLLNMMNALIAPGFNVWHIAHIPSKVRVNYFSIVSMLNGIVVAAANLLASKVVDAFKARGQELAGLETLRIAACVIAVYDIFLLTRIRELPIKKNPTRFTLLDVFTKPWKERVYLRSVMIIFMWSMIANMPGAYYQVYLLRDLHISYSYITATSMFNVVVLILFTPVWRKIFLRHSWLKPLSYAILMLVPHYFLLSFVTKSTILIYPITMFWAFVCTCGINLAFTSVAYINLPEQNQTLYIGFYMTASNMGALVSANLARFFVTGMSGLRFSLFGLPFGEKQLGMMIVGLLMFGVGLKVRNIWKKNEREQVDF